MPQIGESEFRVNIFGDHCHADVFVNSKGLIETITVSSKNSISKIEIPGEWAAQNPSPDRLTLTKEVSESLNGAKVSIIDI